MLSNILPSNAEYSGPVGNMGDHVDLKKGSRSQRTSRSAVEKTLSSQASRNINLSDKAKSEKSVLQSYTDRHPEIKRNIDSGPSILHKSSGNHQKQCFERKTTKEGELVKYMSNLPLYLQRPDRGENLQGKALSFGVLDWERLEKWKCKQKQTPGRSNIDTLSHEKKTSSSLHSHLTSSFKESHSQAVKASNGNSSVILDLETHPKNASPCQKNLSSTDWSFRKNYSDLEKGKGKDSDSRITLKLETSSSNSKHDSGILFSKGKTKTGEGDCMEKTDQFEDFKRPDQYVTGRNKSVVLLLPRDSSKKGCSGVSQHSESAAIDVGRPMKAKRKSFSDNFFVNKEIQFMDVSSDIPHSCPLPSIIESSKQPDLKKYNSVDVLGIKVSSDASASIPFSAENEIPSIHSKDKHAKENNSTIKTPNLTVIKPFKKRTPEAEATSAAKGRYTSPTHLQNVGLGQMGRSCSLKEVSAVPQLSSAYVTVKSGPVGSDAFPCLDNSNRDKTNANGRARTSPLRRLLDPLLKSKAVNRLYSAEPLQDVSIPTLRACELSYGQLDSSTVPPVKRNLSFSSSNPTTKIDGSHENEKHSASMVQGILKVTVKDGLPSFTFAVDNNSDILAATMKKIISSGKYDCSWTYTFYSFRKIKKKSGGWINQGSKCKSHDYNPIVVGEMKVSGSQCPKWTRHKSKDQLMVREFVLFAIEQRQEGPDTLDFQPNSELAAIVVKVPKVTTGCLSSDGWQSNDDSSEVGPPGCLDEHRCSSNSAEKKGSSVGSRSHFSTTVILPSGAHGLPASGIPSPLIDRWRSGGACDCGGWDVGCNLRIFVNQDKLIEDTNSSEDFCNTDQFDLFVQGEATQENRLVFRMATFEKGIYSIDFSSSISSLQAFSICTAILHGRKLAELSEVSNLLEDGASKEIKSGDNDRINLHTPMVGGEAPPTYVPFPPLSPVGRV